MAAITALALPGCSHPGQPRNTTTAPSAVPKTMATSTICTYLTKLEGEALGAKSPTAGLSVLKTALPQIKADLPAAPTALRADLETIIEAADDALAHKDLSYLATDDVAAAGTRLSAACGVGSAPK